MRIITKVVLGTIVLLLLSTLSANAARLFLSPSAGSFTVGSTFDISIFLDTENELVNAFDVTLLFPPEKLQVISPSAGQSITQVWTGPHRFDNQKGQVQFQGGIPNGINVSQGLISEITFRIRRVGDAVVRFSDQSQTLLNDGKGTNVLTDTQNGVYRFVLPPPAGPIVASETHQDQTRWYSNSTVILRWSYDTLVGGFSYMLSDNPVDIPDNISEGINTSVAYRNVSSGTHYFHIKALRDGSWGGVSHFAVSVDTDPPAIFPIRIAPSSRTTSKNPTVIFKTTDAHSGVSHYEYKLVSLNPGHGVGATSFFVETQGQEVFEVELGSYDIIARAYDRAGNFQEVVQNLKVVNPIFQVVSGEGVRIGRVITISWFWTWIIAAIIITSLGFGGFKTHQWYKSLVNRRGRKELPKRVREKLRELHKYRKRYGKIATVIILVSSLFTAFGAGAQQVELAPPFVTTISESISNEEIFYIGGRTNAADIEVIIYLQNLHSGETLSQTVTSDKNREWFYRHSTFLPTGEYLLWTQTKLGDQMSPPSPQISLGVHPTAIQFGASRFSFETLYLMVSILLLLVVIGLISFIIFHAYRGRRHHKEFLKEVREAEEAVRRGFAVLRLDIQAELEIVKKAKLSKALSEEKKKQERQLLKDLALVEQHIGKEVLDIEQLDYH